VYESQTKIELTVTVGDLPCALCKFNLKANNSELIMKLEGCKVTKEHFAHVVCFAKDLALLKILSPECPICHVDAELTIHDTDCQDSIDESGIGGMSIDQDNSGVMASHFRGLDASMKQTQLGVSKKTADLGATNPLDKAIESDEDIY